MSAQVAKKVGTESIKKINWKPTFKAVNIKFGDEARRDIFLGIDRLAKCSALTLGPGGRNVALEYEAGQPKITKDGVTVVKSVFESSRAAALGSKLLKQAAARTNHFAGDGTTTSTLLSHALVKNGFNAIEFGGAHPIALKRELDKLKGELLTFLKDMSLPAVEY